MKGKSGFTLIETVISIFLFALIIVSFMQGLTTTVVGSNKVRMNNAAMNVARSQMEYIQQQEYIVHDEYGYPMEYNETLEQWVYLDVEEGTYNKTPGVPDGFYYDDISINVSLVPAPGSGYDTSVLNRSAMQQIDVTVSYADGKHMTLTGYKAPRLATVVRAAGRYPVSKEITDIPDLFGISSGGEQAVPYDIGACCNSGRCGSAAECAEEGLTTPCHPERQCRNYGGISGGEGYYYVFRTGTAGAICASWIYGDTGSLDHIDCLTGTCDDGIGQNYANVFLYRGIPDDFNDQGQGQGLVELAGTETHPRDICDDADDPCEFLATVGTHYSSDSDRYLASIGTSGDLWPAGVYTVFFHNWGYYDIGCDTISASVAYYW